MGAKHGTWIWSPADYVAFIRRARDALGHNKVHFVATQDWMCEPDMLRRTGLSLAEHQRRTVRSYLELRDLAPEIPLLPALQGHTGDDYLACADLYDRHGVDLAGLRLVGLGSVCRRSGTAELEQVIEYITARLPGVNLHGYGVKSEGAVLSCLRMRSLDSQAGSRRGRGAEVDLRAALGLPAKTRWPELAAAMAARGDTVDLDLVELFEWKRDHGETASIANSIAWAEHWRARQQIALAVAAHEQACAVSGPPVPVQLRLL